MDKLSPTVDPNGRCGSDPGYQAHRKRNETPCDDCRRARSEDRKRRYRKSRNEAGSRTLPTMDAKGRCGTVAGIHAHYRRNESLCPECSLANLEAGRAYHRENPDYYKENYARNAGELRERSRKYREDNAEECRARFRDYYAKNRESLISKSSEWAKNNRERRRAIDGNRRATIAGASVPGAPLTDFAIRMRFDYFGNTCWMCGSDGPMEADHVIPISRGGLHVPANIRPACKSCNSSKGNRWTVDTEMGAGDGRKRTSA